VRQILSGIRERPEHIGLGYGSWAPVAGSNVPQDKRGKVPDGDRRNWLSELAGDSPQRIAVSKDYRHAFDRWKASFLPPDYMSELTLAGRLLVGHGNSSPTEVGLTVHHTWGVPMIPGSALKGLLAHYIDAKYGPRNDLPPWDQEGEETERAKWQSVSWDGNRIQRGPGQHYRALFGSPDAEQDDQMRRYEFDAGAARGLVVFHDALYIPNNAGDELDTPYAVDVLTVHQKRYYDGAGSTWACDFDDPIPVAFLSVRPGARFQLALSGPPDWTELAGALLSDALADWGVGGKTSAGYGHGKASDWKSAGSPPSHTLITFLDWLGVRRTEIAGGVTQGTVLDQVTSIWAERLTSLGESDRSRARQAIERLIKSKSVVDRRNRFFDEFLP